MGSKNGTEYAKQLMKENRNIEAYLRSFYGEKERWSELIESTLVYGIHCLAQNYPLQTLTIDQIQHLTSTQNYNDNLC